MKKGLLLAAVILVAAGLCLAAGAYIASGFDLSAFSTGKSQTNTYVVTEAFQNLEIQTFEADVRILPSPDGSCRVFCTEREKVRHTVSAENGTLRIQAEDLREWADHVSIFTPAQSVEVYLPESDYASLSVSCSTGDVLVPASFSFTEAKAVTSTGDIDFAAAVSGRLELRAGTGDISMKGTHAGEAALTVTTGEIKIESVTCGDTFSADVSTGKITLSSLSCRTLLSTGGTGDLTLKDVTAEERFDLSRGTGDIRLEDCDAGEILIKTTTGDVTGSLRTDKVFLAKSATGRVRVPETVSGGPCRITTTTGDIEITVSGK